MGAKVLVYEAGEPHRFNDDAIKTGVNGVMRTLRSLKMVDARLPRTGPTRQIRRTRWVRARRGGLVEIRVALGQYVEKAEPIAAISDAFGSRPAIVKANETGWVIGRTLQPLVNSGDALVHIAVQAAPEGDVPAERGS